MIVWEIVNFCRQQDILVQGRGSAVEPNSASALADGLLRLMQDAALRHRLAEGALQTAGDRGWDEVYDQLLRDYRGAIRNRRTGMSKGLDNDVEVELSTRL